MGDNFSARNENELRALARKQIGEGKLPRAKALRTWGGLGSGLPCDLCREPILQTEPEFELQFDNTPGSGLRFHRQCHSVWELARHEPATEHEHWTAVGSELPPIGAPVEVRWEMGDTRTLILTCARNAGISDPVWINLTTKAPLPHGWRPIEWRPTPGAPPQPTPEPEIEPAAVPKRA
jgi:hypothetical protein